jgi:uncharacterized membrane protein (UPF0127 family)
MEYKKIIWVVLLLAVALLLAGAGGEEYSPYGNPYTVVTIGQVKVKAEVVSSPEKLFLGLGQRPGLPEGQGMLFVMPRMEVQTFCMRGMRFPLDLIWLRQGQVAGLARNIAPDYPGVMVSPVPVNYVLEVPAGFCDRHGIKVGDPARW